MAEWSDDDLIGLPGILGEIAALCSVGTALKFARALGGRRFYFCRPENLHHDHPLVQAVGFDDAITIVQHYNGDIVEVPKAERWHLAARNRMMRRDAESGSSQSSLSKRYLLTVRQVRNVLGQTDQHPNMDLFDDPP